MNQSQLSPLADVLIYSYLETATYSRDFERVYGQPSTMMAKAQHLRAVAQSLMTDHERYQLFPQYTEYGKLQVADRETGRIYLVRSSGAYAIEDARQGILFPAELANLATEVVMVIYNFHRDGMDLSIAGTRKVIGKQRLFASGPARFVATWPYVTAGPQPPFNQGSSDPFGDVGNIHEVESEGEAG